MRTTLDWDTVEVSIPSLFRGPDVMITACGCPGKAAARTRGGEGGGPAMRLLPDTGTEPGPARLHGDWGASGAAHDPSAATETLPPHCRAWRDDARFLQLLLGGDRLQTQARDDQGYIFFHNGLRLEEHHRPENRLDLYTSSFTTLLLPRSRCVCVTSLPQGMLKRPWGQETSQGWGWGGSHLPPAHLAHLG